jgi:curved DNA-binding protein CbpA
MVVKKKNYYEMLGLTPEVPQPEIKRAYRKLVKSHHPDVAYEKQSQRQRNRANEAMQRLNEAYETLKDRKRRAAYDFSIGANGRSGTVVQQTQLIHPDDTDEARELFLRQIFHPSRQEIIRLLNKYKQQLRELSQDIYDDRLVGALERYGDDIEQALAKASQALSSRKVPRSLVAAELMMRYSIAQAFDGLEELKRFCQNYDYDHLSMAGNLFRESNDLSKKALQLTKT